MIWIFLHPPYSNQCSKWKIVRTGTLKKLICHIIANIEITFFTIISSAVNYVLLYNKIYIICQNQIWFTRYKNNFL